jgi:hypothetical protein
MQRVTSVFIGHDPQVLAFKTLDLEHLTDDASLDPETGEGTLSFTQERPLTWNEWRQLRLDEPWSESVPMNSRKMAGLGRSWRSRRIRGAAMVSKHGHHSRRRSPHIRAHGNQN